MGAERSGTSVGVIESKSEALLNQEQFLVNTIAMVVHGNDAVRRNGTHQVLHAELGMGRINTLSDLGRFIKEIPLPQDDKNGLGRQIFRTAVSTREELQRCVDSSILYLKYPRWLTETFGRDRVKRWQMELERSNS